MNNLDEDINYLKRLNLIIEKTKSYYDCVFPVGSIGEFGALYISDLKKALLELETYKRQNKIKNEYLQLLIDLGIDYDGLNTVESLKGLIDDLIDYAKLALENNDKEFIFWGGKDKKYNILREEIEVEENV